MINIPANKIFFRTSLSSCKVAAYYKAGTVPGEKPWGIGRMRKGQYAITSYITVAY
jgi:hypothetical protein